jgi:hypothetical protein
MKGKLGLAVGLAAGYVLGTRAGRERYQQLTASAKRLADDPSMERLQTEIGNLFGRTAPPAATTVERPAEKAATTVEQAGKAASAGAAGGGTASSGTTRSGGGSRGTARKGGGATPAGGADAERGNGKSGSGSSRRTGP